MDHASACLVQNCADLPRALVLAIVLEHLIIELYFGSFGSFANLCTVTLAFVCLFITSLFTYNSYKSAIYVFTVAVTSVYTIQ